MERLVQLIKGDEGPETKDDDAPPPKAELNGEVDDEDYEITEV